MQEDIKKILEAGVQAPSGGNSQPWKFKISDNQVDIFYFPEKDHPILNFKNRGTLIAHGALIENIKIAASSLGYKSALTLFPINQETKILASFVFEKSNPKTEPLYQEIFKRTTNRKAYNTTPLTEDQKTKLFGEGFPKNESIKIIEDQQKIKEVAEAVSMNEVIMLENKLLHKLFFKEVVWTEKEEKQKGGGLFLKTLELKTPQQFALKLFKHWPMMRFANKFGMSKLIAKDNAKVYAATPVMGIIVVEDKDEAFIEAGKLMENIWLKATQMGLSFHLITGILFFHQRIEAGQSKEFSPEHIKLVQTSYQKIANAFGISSGVIAMVFRIGQSEPPTAHSLKLPPEIIEEK